MIKFEAASLLEFLLASILEVFVLIGATLSEVKSISISSELESSKTKHRKSVPSNIGSPSEKLHTSISSSSNSFLISALFLDFFIGLAIVHTSLSYLRKGFVYQLLQYKKLCLQLIYMKK